MLILSLNKIKIFGAKIQISKVNLVINNSQKALHFSTKIQIHNFTKIKFLDTIWDFLKKCVEKMADDVKVIIRDVILKKRFHDWQGIVQWLKKKSGPPAIDVKTLAAFQELKESNNVLVLGCFSNQDSAKAKAFMDAAKKIDDFEVAITSVKDVIAENVAQDETIVLFKNFDDPKTEFAGEFNAEEIKQWVDDNSVPLVWEFSQATAQKIFKGAAKVHYIYFEENKENFATVKEALKSAAVEYKGKVAFVVVDASDAPNANVLQFFGVKKDQLPMAAIFEMDSNSKYLREANQAADSKEVLETMKKYFNGEIEKTMKTEEIPEDWDKEPVKVLVGKNFNQVALDKSKDVFVEFYAPWCGKFLFSFNRQSLIPQLLWLKQNYLYFLESKCNVPCQHP